MQLIVFTIPVNTPKHGMLKPRKEQCDESGRLDEKYAERRAVQKIACYNLISSVFSEYFYSEMPGSSLATRGASETKRPTKPTRTRTN